MPSRYCSYPVTAPRYGCHDDHQWQSMPFLAAYKLVSKPDTQCCQAHIKLYFSNNRNQQRSTVDHEQHMIVIKVAAGSTALVESSSCALPRHLFTRATHDPSACKGGPCFDHAAQHQQQHLLCSVCCVGITACG